MIRPLACTLGLSLLCSAALAEDRNASQAQDQTAAQAQTAAQGQAQAQPAAAKEQGDQAMDPAQMFIKEAYIDNLFEVKAAQLAQQKLRDPQIKRLAQMLIEDHSKNNEELKQLAQGMSLQLTSEQLDPVHQAKLAKMQKIPASEFDRKFINSQVAGHTMDVLEFTYQSHNAQNAQLKQYAAKTLPVLEQHLKHASDLASQQAGGEARTVGDRQPGDRSAGHEGHKSGAAGRSGSGTDAGSSSGTGTSGQSGASDSSAKDASPSGGAAK